MTRLKRIALLCPLSEPHHARALRGIMDYAREYTEWTFNFCPETRSRWLGDPKEWSGDGVIALISTQAEVRAAKQAVVPVVNLSGWLRPSDFPRVMVDQAEMGRLAAQHLLERGFRRFGYYGVQDVWFAEQRGAGFSRQVRLHGGQCSILEAPRGLADRPSSKHWLQPLERWLRTLRLPVGILAVHDLRALMVVDACTRLGLRVPDDVAVMGVDDNQITCELCQVALSSVSRSGWKVGYEAARLLDRLMAGEPPPREDVLVPPDGIVARRSTDVMAVDDPHVAVAVRFIREHIGEAFGIKRLLSLVPVSRQWLTRRFKQDLGMTPHEFICRTRVERARQLLTAKERMPLQAVAKACGFGETRRFRIVFERLAGMTPAAYRRAQAARKRGPEAS